MMSIRRCQPPVCRLPFFHVTPFFSIFLSDAALFMMRLLIADYLRHAFRHFAAKNAMFARARQIFDMIFCCRVPSCHAARVMYSSYDKRRYAPADHRVRAAAMRSIF